MAPKKLTDCPENLREAIDWLIQVRHGGDGSGLDKLAKALKRLLGRSIERAYISFCDTLCTIIDSAGQRYECCREKIEAIKALKKNVNKAGNVEEDKLRGLLDAVRALKNGCGTHHRIDSSTDKALDDITSRLDNLDGLRKNLCGFTGDPTPILNNLCDGLQTFLGYDVNSKGYNGTGIVYSDLDRLCDGVMGFLLSCLEGSKELLKHYNPQITETIEHLNNSIGKGSGVSGFAQAIGKVKSGLQGYERQLEERIEGVTKPLTTMQNDLSELETYLNNVGSKNLETQLSEVSSKAYMYWVKAGGALANATELDDNLSNKVKIPINQIFQAVEIFKDVNENEQLQKQAAAVDDELGQRETLIKRRIREGSTGVQETLYREFIKIGESLKCVTKEKDKQIPLMKSAVKEAQHEVKGLLDGLEASYTNTISKKFEQITEQLKELQNDPEGTNQSQLRRGAEQIIWELKAVGAQLGTHVEKLSTRIGDAEKLRGNAEIKANQALSMVNVEDSGRHQNNLKQAADALKTKTTTLMETYDRVKDAVRVAKEAAAETLLGLDNLIKADLTTLKMTIVDPIERYFQLVDAALKEAVENAGISSTRFVQEFLYYSEVRDNLPKLYEWVTAKKNVLDPALEVLDGHGKFVDFTGFVKKLYDEKHLISGKEKTFFGTIGEDVNTKIGGVFKPYENNGFGKSMKNYTGNDDYARGIASGKKKLQKEIASIDKDMKPLEVNETNKSRFGITEATQVIKEIDGLHGEITKAVGEFTAAVQKLLKNDGPGDGPKDGLLDILEALQNNIGQTTEGEESLCKVHKQLESLHTNEIKNIGAIQKAINEVIFTVAELEMVPENVVKAQKAAYSLMGELKKEIEATADKINNIDNAIVYTEIALNKVIEDAYRVLSAAEEQSKQALQTLQRHLTTTISSAFLQIKNEVRTLFAKQKQTELTTLGNVVTAKLEDLDRIVNEDKANDLKGYLGKIMSLIKGNLDLPDASEFVKSITLKQLSWGTRGYFEGILDYVYTQVTTSSLPDSSTAYPKIIDGIKNNLNVLLNDLTNFNKTFTDQIETLKMSIGTVLPDRFDGNNNILLDLVRNGVGGFITELDYAYVSKYSEQTVKWRNTNLPDALALDEDELTEDSTKCAKVFCSIISTLYDELSQLSENCKTGGNCEKKKIDLNNLLTFGKSGHTKTDINPLGHFLKRCGYRVASLPDVSDAELLNKPTMMGSDIFNLLVGYGRVFSRKTTDDGTADESVMYKVLKHLHDYYKTCHLGNNKSTKHPSTVRDMLHWLCGLWHNPMLEKVEKYFKELFQKPDALKDVPYAAIDATKLRLSGTTTIQPYDLTTELYKVCSHSEKVLIAILGYGHAGGRYACEFNTNPDNLDYPTDPSKCFDWLVEVLVRLHHQLSFLYNQCGNGTSSSGWLDCLYGKDVGGSSWRCNELKCTEPICGIKCKRHPRCGMKSPLQSFLEDGLPGFLPHKFEKPDCKITCSLANHHGIPCNTPMGFADISTVASHTMKGQHLMKVLAGFCSKSDRPLTKLCSYLVCVLQRPPQTLDEMYAFYYNFIYGWGDLQNSEHKSNAFNRAVNEASFNRGITLDVTRIADNAAHGEHHVRGDLSSLVSCNDRSSPVSPCGPYLHPLSLNVRCIYSKEHADKYLSWIVYLTETFYNALCRLLSKCEENCGANISKCRSEGCASDCQMLKSATHSSSCQSILECPYTLPELYTEGVVFGNTIKIGGRIGNPWKRSCGDFIDQLKKVCRGKTILAEYVHIIIPDYLFKIRAPFIWLNVALWLLSLLYLLHIMIIRLDLLHIKSHLHSPSSHRIAAQSLLTAARVKALNKVLYLQP